MTLVKNPQALFALFLLVLNAGYFAEALTLPLPFAMGEPGPAFLPLVLSVVLFIAAGQILWAELRGTGEAEAEGAPVGGFAVKPIAIAVLTAVYIVLFESIGYWLSTYLYSFAVAALFETETTSRPVRIIIVAAIIAAAATAAGWLFFVTLFDLYLPTGDWLPWT